ncbi:amidohydrolase [bacterium]|nr:amidohydrolase [bacterium]MBU1024473.1 amidohydrolase [bacterium]
MYLLKNGNVFTPSGWKSGFSVLTDGKKIADVAKEIKTPSKGKVIDCIGLYVIPGIVEAHSHLGVYEEGAGIMGAHYNEGSDPITPQVRAIDAVFPRDPGFRYALEGGITTAVANPGSANLIGGLNVVLKCLPNAQTVEEMIIKEPEGMKFALGENPFRFYGKDQGKPPKTRMGCAATTRATLMKCRDYMSKKKKAKLKKEIFDEDLGMENLSLVLERKIPARWHCHRADDILTALRIAKEFNFKIVIEHATEGHLIVDELKKRKIDCVVGPINTALYKQELRERSISLPAILNKAGIRVAITTDHPVAPIWTIPILAAMAVKGGMDEIEALKAITIYPAEIIGLQNRIGSLKKNKDADIAIFDGHPLDARSHCVRVFLEGKELFKA